MSKPNISNSDIITHLTTSWAGGDNGMTRTWLTSNVHFSLPTSSPDGSHDESDGFQTLTANEASFARQAFKLWDDLVNITITETTGSNAPITFAYSSTTNHDGTYTTPWTNSHTSTDRAIDHEQVWIDSGWNSNQSANIKLGSYGFMTYIHEIGHALGLSHPGVYNATDDESPTYDDDATYSRDTRQYTVMSYFGAGSDGSGAAYSGSNASTPMIDDILAIQAKYGADMTTRTGGNTYGFNATAGNAVYDFSQNTKPVFSIWDAGGQDKIDASQFFNAQTIDLRAGHYSSIGGLTQNIGIAYNVTIENAAGGWGNDTIYGNEVANNITGSLGADTLLGAGGADVLDGGTGDDILDGGTGVDAMTGGLGNDTYYVDNAGALVATAKVMHIGNVGLTGIGQLWFGDKVIEQANQGIDKVMSTISYSLGDNVENLQLLGSSNINGSGNSLDNTLIGNAGSNILSGGAGNDVLDGSAGVDTMKGGAGNDTYFVDDQGGLVLAQARVSLTGVILPTHLFWMGDQVVEAADSGIDTVNSSISYTLADNVENLNLTGNLALNGSGNALDNTIFGNSAANTLNGGDGNDQLFGQGGADVLNGGAGNDYLDGGTGADKLAGGTGDDMYIVDTAGRWHFDPGTVFGGITTVTLASSAKSGHQAEAIVNHSDVLDLTHTGVGIGTTFTPGDQVTENANEGIDTVLSSISYTLGANVENLTLTGSGSLAGYGNELDNQIAGNDADNVLDGRGGNDTLRGFGGADVFQFSTALASGAVVNIADFAVGVDSIHLAASIFTSLTAGVLAIDEFVRGDQALDANDHLIYNSDTGALIYDENGSEAGGDTQFATVGTNLDLTAQDFLVA